MSSFPLLFFFFFFNDTATTEIYTLSLHDALPISIHSPTTASLDRQSAERSPTFSTSPREPPSLPRSEEHTSELQSPCNLVCRLLLEKKKKHQSHKYSPVHIYDLTTVYSRSLSLLY